MDTDLKETLSGIRTDVKDGFKEINERLSRHGEQIAIVSTKFEGLEDRVVRVESAKMPASIHPSKNNDLSTKQIIAIIGGIVALLTGGGGLVVTQQVDKAKEEVVERSSAQQESQREAMAILARALSQSNKAQSAGAEAMATLDPQAAEEAKKAAREAVAEAMKAERALRQNSEELQP